MCIFFYLDCTIHDKYVQYICTHYSASVLLYKHHFLLKCIINVFVVQCSSSIFTYTEDEKEAYYYTRDLYFGIFFSTHPIPSCNG